MYCSTEDKIWLLDQIAAYHEIRGEGGNGNVEPDQDTTKEALPLQTIYPTDIYGGEGGIMSPNDEMPDLLGIDTKIPAFSAEEIVVHNRRPLLLMAIES